MSTNEQRAGLGVRLMGYCRDALLIAFVTAILALLSLTSETNDVATTDGALAQSAGDGRDCPS